MNADDKHVAPDVEHLVLQTRAAHVYLEAIGALSSPERRRQNRAHAEAVLGELEGYLQKAECSPDDRIRVGRLKAGLKAELDRTIL